MKENNQHLVLQLIQGHGPISRTAIAQASGLSPAAVSGITAELIGDGLVEEIGATGAAGRVGRRAILLRVNPHAGYVVGITLGQQHITGVITDLDATVLHVNQAPLPAAAHHADGHLTYDPEPIIAAVIETVEQLRADAQVDATRVLGIGVGVNGIVDSNQGISRLAPLFGWRNVPLAAPLTAHFGIPVHLENGARTLAIAEQWFGAGRDVANFAAVAVGYGIGAGVVTNGQLYRGAHGGAGEFGHMVLQADGPPCSCGKRGCVESLAAEPAMLRQLEAALAAGEASSLAAVPELSLDLLVNAAIGGDTLARRVLADAGRWLGIGLANFVNILNPELLIINGEVVRCGRWYFEPMERALRDHALGGLADSLRIVIEPYDTNVWARGAASIVLSAVFAGSAHRAP